MRKIDVEMGGYRIVSDDCQSGTIYAPTGEVDVKWLLVGQWCLYGERILMRYDAPQDVDCAQLVREALEADAA